MKTGDKSPFLFVETNEHMSRNQSTDCSVKTEDVGAEKRSVM